jgi:uncharacterized SAM-binding protein YcdF (DUF218 family)
VKLPALACRRTVWLPTPVGALLLLLALAGALFAAGRHLHVFLAPSQPAPGARVLVVEGWLSAEALAQALEIWSAGGYDRIVTSGGPIESEFERRDADNYAERARLWLERHGVPPDRLSAAPAPRTERERTFGNALALRDWLARNEPSAEAIDVFSSGAHARRSWALYRAALEPSRRVGILRARPTEYDPDHWWRSSAGAKVVLEELVAWSWTQLFFWPG